MQRKAVRRALPGIAMVTALLAGAAGLTGCTGGSGGGGTVDAKSGGSPAPSAQPPGKYRILPAPCKAGVDSKKLKAMLPAADSLTPEQREQLYAGVADPSYDADRHVGCRWTGQTPAETRLLAVRFERVVSYDRAATSDDDKARQVYVRRLTDAHLPFPGPVTSPTPPAPTASTASTPPPAPPGGTPTPTGSPAPELGSRVLEDLGNEAFLEDKLSPAGATAAQARTVRIVFRTSNVIVTLEYGVQPTLPGAVPPSAENQDKVRQLAQALVERLGE